MTLYDWTIGFLLDRPWYSLVSLGITFGAGYHLFRYNSRSFIWSKILALISLYSGLIAFFILTSAVVVGEFLWPPSGPERFLLFAGACLMLFEVCNLTLQGTPVGGWMDELRSRHLSSYRPIPASHPLATQVARLKEIKHEIGETSGASLKTIRDDFLEVRAGIETQIEPLGTPQKLEDRIDTLAHQCEEEFAACIEDGGDTDALGESLSLYKGTVTNIPLRRYETEGR